MNKELWQKIQEGNSSAYEQLYFEYFRKFFNYGKKFTADVLLIEDSIQEVFIEIWNKKKKIAELGSPNSYFFSAFRFILFEKIRRSKREQGISIAEEVEFSSEQQIMIRELETDLTQKLSLSLQALTPRQREAVFLRFYEGLSYEEVAAVLNITVKATYKIMARSLQTLKEQMNELLVALAILVYFYFL